MTIFNEIVGKEVQEIFDQRLLLSSQGINFEDIEDQVSFFGPKNFLEILEGNIKIYIILIKKVIILKKCLKRKMKE